MRKGKVVPTTGHDGCVYLLQLQHVLLKDLPASMVARAPEGPLVCRESARARERATPGLALGAPGRGPATPSRSNRTMSGCGRTAGCSS